MLTTGVVFTPEEVTKKEWYVFEFSNGLIAQKSKPFWCVIAVTFSQVFGIKRIFLFAVTSPNPPSNVISTSE